MSSSTPSPKGCTQGCHRNVAQNKGLTMFGLVQCHPESPGDCAFRARGSRDTRGWHVSNHGERSSCFFPPPPPPFV